MPSPVELVDPAEHQYRIAAVSRLVGIPVPTIRMWERRYQVVSPARSAGNGRLYSRTDIDRLILLKSAVDAGHAIGTIAHLRDEQILERLREAPVRVPPAVVRDECRVLVCGHALELRLREAWAQRGDVRVVAAIPTPGVEPPRAIGELDAVLVEAPTVHAATIRVLRQLRERSHARVVVVVYGFCNRQTLSRLDQEGFLAVATPADPAQLARICLLGLALDAQPAESLDRRLVQPAAPRRYDDAFLATLARRSTAMRCECPNHLADLLAKMNAFEQYSLECESSSTDDASIHAFLYSAAAQCRELFEHALHRVLQHEGIDEPEA